MARGLANAVALGVLGAGLALGAAGPANEIPLWTDSRGKFSVQAEFVRGGYDAGNKRSLVYLKKLDGTIISVPLDALGQESKQLAIRLQAERRSDPQTLKAKSGQTAAAAPSNAATTPRKAGKPPVYGYSLPFKYEFLFGLPGYSIVLSRGGIDDNVLGLGYYIHRHYQGGKRERKAYVVVEPSVGNDESPMVAFR